MWGTGLTGPPFLTSTLDGSDWSASRSGRFTSGEITIVLTGQEAGWAPESVWTLWRTEKSPYAGNRIRIF
jgi:hypothetical protein